MSWNRENQKVIGRHKMNGHHYLGQITSSRVKLGGTVQHTVKLVAPIELFPGDERWTILINEDEILNGDASII